MTREEAAAEQEQLAKDYDLGWWFGTECSKCCGVYPRLHVDVRVYDYHRDACWYECDVCGKKTVPKAMPWMAADEWNAGHYAEGQTRFC